MLNRTDLPTMQTPTREDAIKALQPAINMNPPGHFEKLLNKEDKSELNNLVRNTDDRLNFDRHRLVSIDWDNILPENVNGDDIAMAYVRDYFEKRWGFTPYEGRFLTELVIEENIGGHSLKSDMQNKSIYATWPVNSPFYKTQTFIEKGNEKYWLVCSPQADLISNYDDTWARRVKRVVRVKKTIRHEDLIREIRKPIKLEIDPRALEQHYRQMFEIQSDVGIPGRIPGMIDYPGTDSQRYLRGIESEEYAIEGLIEYIDKNVPLVDLVAVDEMKRLVEEEWNLIDEPDEPVIYNYKSGQASKLFYVSDEAVTGTGGNKEVIEEPFFNGGSIVTPKKALNELPEGSVVLMDPVCERHYWGRIESGINPIMSDSTSYESFWEDIESVELVSDGETGQPSTSIIIGRNETRLILDKFSVLDGDLILLTILQNKYTNWLETNVPNEASALEDLELKYYANSFVSVSQKKRSTEQAISELRALASRMGYVLALETKTHDYMPYENEKNAPANVKAITVSGIKRGNLYITRSTTINWSERHTKNVSKRKRNGRTWSGRKKYKWVTEKVDYQINRVSQYTDWIPVVPGDEPWMKYRDTLTSTGKATHVISKADEDYYTDSGERLSEVMDKCRNSETYRDQTVLFFPEYDQSIRKGMVVAKYHVISKPLPGMIPIGLPRVRFRESLSFRKKLLGNEIGELVKSINLAPGEKRKITYKRTFERKVDTTRTIKNYLDIETMDSNSFDDILETELRSEAKDSNSDNSNSGLNITGEYKNTKGGLNLSESSNDTSSLTEFDREFEKIARKTSKNQKKRTTEEVEVRFSDVVTSSNEESYESDIENINQGVTLNLMFYRVFNSYAAGLFLDSISFQVTSPFEIVQGTGIFPIYYRGKNEFEEFIKDLQGFTDAYELAGIPPSSIVNAYLSECTRTLDTEYRSMRSIEMDDPAGDTDLGEGEGWKKVGDIVKSLTLKEEPLSTYIVDSVSDSFFLDSLMGVNPATEPYSESMRIEKLNREAAETRLVAAKADALSLTGDMVEVLEPTFDIIGNVIEFSSGLIQGDWVVLVDGSPVARARGKETKILLPNDGNEYETMNIAVIEQSRGLELRRS